MKKYAFFLHGDEDQTNYDVQKAFAAHLGLNIRPALPAFPKPMSSISLPKDYFSIFLNRAGDLRDPSMGFYLDIVKHVVAKTGLHLVVIGPVSDERCRAVEEFFPNDFVYDLCGKTALEDYVYVVANSRLLISSDTSAAHIANAYRTPSICFCCNMFGDSLFPYQWGYGSHHQLIIQQQMACHDCCRKYNGKHPLPSCGKKRLCVDLFSVFDAISVIDAFLAKESLGKDNKKTRLA